MEGTTSQNLRTFSKDFNELERLISMGYIDKSIAFKVDKFSRAVLSNNVVSLLSSFNNQNPFLDIPVELFMASDDNADSVDILVEYIDQNRDSKIKTITLNGTTPISMGIDIYCIFRMSNSGITDILGTSVVATSNATGIPSNDSEVFCEIIEVQGIPSNQSLTAIYSVPRGFSGFLINSSISADKNTDVKGAMFLRQKDKVFKFQKALPAYQNKSDFKDLFQRADEETDIKPLAVAQTGGIVYINFTILCINSEYLDKHIFEV